MAAPKKLKVKILLPVAGKFKLSANVGEKVSYPEALAQELIDAKYAELVTKAKPTSEAPE